MCVKRGESAKRFKEFFWVYVQFICQYTDRILIVKLFTYSFNFAYGVFGNVAYHPGSQQYIVVDIPADSSIMEIGSALQDAEIIEDKYVFYAKVKVKGYGNKITSGKYHLSASMTYDEILQIICNIDTSSDEENE